MGKLGWRILLVTETEILKSNLFCLLTNSLEKKLTPKSFEFQAELFLCFYSWQLRSSSHPPLSPYWHPLGPYGHAHLDTFHFNPAPPFSKFKVKMSNWKSLCPKIRCSKRKSFSRWIFSGRRRLWETGERAEALKTKFEFWKKNFFSTWLRWARAQSRQKLLKIEHFSLKLTPTLNALDHALLSSTRASVAKSAPLMLLDSIINFAFIRFLGFSQLFVFSPPWYMFCGHACA